MERSTKNIFEFDFLKGSITYIKLPRKLKKQAKNQIIKGTEWKSNECKVIHFTRNFRGKKGCHKVTSYKLG